MRRVRYEEQAWGILPQRGIVSSWSLAVLRYKQANLSAAALSLKGAPPRAVAPGAGAAYRIPLVVLVTSG